MTSITTDDALRDLSTGYCLWVGAGVGVHLGAAASSKVPGWAEVVDRLEASAGLTPPPGVAFADRIDRCLRALRRIEFQKHLRAAIVKPLSEAIVKLANDHEARTPCLPTVARQLAHLGSVANPIVNFNVETTTSRLIADPSGISNIRCFAPPVPGATTLLRARTPEALAFRRSVYHPHGAVDDSGICVMASTEYESMRGTLGLQLAVHNAFEGKLAIVGMSLDDAYLREQLRAFRSQIDTIYWFASGVRPDDESWAWANGVTLVRQPWATFWERVEAILPGPTSEVSLHRSWLQAVTEACNERFGRTQTCRSIAIHLGQSGSVDAATLDEWRWLARIRGEDGNVDMSLDEANGQPEGGKAARDALYRHLDSAARMDEFCREVAGSGEVFFEWKKDDSVLSVMRVRSAREFWSSEKRALTALAHRYRENVSKYRAAPMRWDGVVGGWREEAGGLDFAIRVNAPGDPTLGIDVPAARIVSRIEARARS